MDIPPPLPPQHQIAELRVKPDKPRSKHFQLHLVSKILIGISVLLTLVATYQEAREHDPNSGYMIGYFVGSLISPFVLPLLLGWLSWRLSGKRLWAGNVVFSVILGLTCLSQLAGMASAYLPKPQAPEVLEINRRLNELDAVGKNLASTVEERLGAIDSVANGMDDYAKSTNNEREAITLRVGAKSMRQINEMLEAFAQAQDVSIEDESFSLNAGDYTDPDQFDHAREVIQAYGQTCRHIVDYYAQLEANITALFIQEGFSPPDATQAAAQMASGVSQQRRDHIDLVYGIRYDYATSIDKYLKLLQENWGKWEYDPNDDTVYFEDDDTIAAYNQLTNRIVWLEECMNELNAEMAQQE